MSALTKTEGLATAHNGGVTIQKGEASLTLTLDEAKALADSLPRLVGLARRFTFPPEAGLDQIKQALISARLPSELAPLIGEKNGATVFWAVCRSWEVDQSKAKSIVEASAGDWHAALLALDSESIVPF
jgi:hypothetical protein